MKCGQGSPGLTRRCALDPLNARTSARYSRANSLPTCANKKLCFASAAPRVRLLCLATPAGCMVAKQGALPHQALTWGVPPYPKAV